MKRVTDISGVFAGAVASGIKKSGLDLAYLHVPNAESCAGVFTRNAFRGACLDHTKACLESASVKAVIINSGNSNVATGEQGRLNVKRTAEKAAKLLALKPEEVAVASTGIIGVPLPIEKVEAGLEKLLENPNQQDGLSAAEAIMTTDLVRKEVYLEREIAGERVVVAGFAKGSGMIAPNMGTMLAYLVVNAALPQRILQKMLEDAVDASFNMVSVDTDTSTSDMALLFSTAEVSLPTENPDIQSEVGLLIEEACVELAKMIARDGEGAERLLEVVVAGASSVEDARAIALSVISSPLVKTAVHGADPNWGRVVMAVGKTPGVKVEPSRVKLSFGEQLVFAEGEPLAEVSLAEVSKTLQASEVRITVELGLGSEGAVAWGCDLTKKYIDINVDYN